MNGIKRIYQKLVGRAVLGTSIIALVFVGLVRPNPGALQSDQTQTPSVTAANVFDHDLADVKDSLITDINKLKDKTKCYPPRVTFKIFSSAPTDPSFEVKLAEARKQYLEVWLGSRQSSLQPDQYQAKDWTNIQSVVERGKDGQVELSFATFNTQDKDPPKLKDIIWSPTDGSVVSEGQQIEVTVTASEKYEDGHKSWPTGVKSITLVAIGNKVSEWPNPSAESPKPCDRVTWHGTYTVPKTTASTITVCAIAEDYAQHRSSQCAKFNINVMPANCKRKGRAHAERLDGSPPLGAFDPKDPNYNMVSCNFRWSVCAGIQIKQKLVKNAPGACQAFFESEKAKLPTVEVCCDCYPNCGAQRKPKE